MYPVHKVKFKKDSKKLSLLLLGWFFFFKNNVHAATAVILPFPFKTHLSVENFSKFKVLHIG
jgi:hypothetical protein